MGGFIGSVAMEDTWIRPQVDVWAEGVKALARVAMRFPQTAYVGLCDSQELIAPEINETLIGYKIEMFSSILILMDPS